ncbi:MAG TPA: FCD domain-containing protein [Conexibacter sp.]|jgi:DNA-binding FadR family transcriptional regulator|nr:FCD domain-containing protein [Conexibacter sp.]
MSSGSSPAWGAHRVLDHAGETASSLAVHQPIADAIAAHDVEGARAAMAAHMEGAQRRLRNALAMHGDGASLERI